MRLYSFQRLDSYRGKEHRYSNQLTLYVSPTTFILSGMLANKMGIHDGANVTIAFNEDDNSQVFIRKADSAKDNEHTQSATVRCAKNTNSFRFSHVEASRLILDATGAAHSVTLYVAPRASRIEGHDYYQLLITNPKRIR